MGGLAARTTTTFSKALGNEYFWLTLAMLSGLSLIHYTDNLDIGSRIIEGTPFGLTRHTLDRVLFLMPILYAGYNLRLKAGLVVCLASLAIMLPRAILISSSPRDALLETAGIVLVGIITCFWFDEQSKADKQRERQELLTAQYRSIFTNASDAIWVHDLKGKILTANEATARLTGYSLDELLTMNVGDFLSEEGIETSREIKAKLLRRKTLSEPYDQEITRKDGTEALLRISSSSIMEGEKIVAFQHIARDITRQRQMEENLRYYVQAVTRAQEEERKRIARELHDETIQQLIALSHQIEDYTHTNDNLSPETIVSLNNWHQHLKNTLQGLRLFSRDLRPPMLDDLGLIPSLEWLIEQMNTEYALNVNLTVTGTQRRITSEAELLLFRMIQEALNNVRRHAEASRVEVTVEFDSTKICVCIQDNGKGFEFTRESESLSRSGKFGLIGMEERARLLGAAFTVQSEPCSGTKIAVEVPLKQVRPVS